MWLGPRANRLLGLAQGANPMNGIAVITGASSGIGREAARCFLASGWAVVGLSRRPCNADGAISIQVDLEDTSFEANVSVRLNAALDQLDPARSARLCMIHNAARFHADLSLNLDAEALRAMLQVNVVAPAGLNRLIAPRLTPGSSILYVGSTLSEKGVPGLASYVTSKHAVVGLMRSTCQDLVGQQVHTVCICPGFVDTPMLRRGRDDAALAPMAAMTTYNRVVQPGEIAGLLLTAANTPALNSSLIHAHYGQIER